MEAIKEFTYLCTQKAVYYRNIMRIFFREYEKMRFQLYKEDIYEKIIQIPNFENYTIDDLKTDLDVLVSWNNLTAFQDSKKVYTIAEYKNREFRYSMTEISVAIERMIIEAENSYFESGNLSTNYVIKIQNSLEKIKSIYEKENNLEDINELWQEIQNDFKNLNQNYQDYLKEFYSKKTEALIKAVEFIIYKDKFISILKNFVRELQINSSKMEKTIKSIEDEVENNILNLIFKSEIEKQELRLTNLHLNSSLEEKEKFKSIIKENITGRWHSLKNWFISTDTRLSEYRQILNITEEIIEKIIYSAFFITQKQNWGVNKKDEYKQFLKMFAECADIDEAHKLSANVFGVQSIRHYAVNSSRTSDSHSESVYGEKIIPYILESHNRSYKPKVEKSGFEDKQKIKAELNRKYKEKLEKDKKMILKYLKNKKLDISQIEETISSDFRLFILNLITTANSSYDKIGRTEYGQLYKVIETDKRFILNCEDGKLEMPVYIFEFLED